MVSIRVEVSIRTAKSYGSQVWNKSNRHDLNHVSFYGLLDFTWITLIRGYKTDSVPVTRTLPRFVHKGPIGNKLSLFQVMARRHMAFTQIIDALWRHGATMSYINVDLLS